MNENDVGLQQSIAQLPELQEHLPISNEFQWWWLMIGRQVTQALGGNLWVQSYTTIAGRWKWGNTYSYLEVGMKAQLFTWLMFSKLTSIIEGQGGNF